MANALLIGVGSLAVGGAVGFAARDGGLVLDRMNRALLARLGPMVYGVGGEPERLPELLRWWRVLTAVLFVLFWVGFGMPPVAIFVAFVSHKVGPLAVEWWASARRKKISEQAASAARMLAGQVRVGMALGEALAAVARDTPDPLGVILRRTTAQLDQGKDVREVLADLKAKVQVDAVSLMCTALMVATERGGKLGDVLGRISHSLEELQRVTRKRDADTAAGRLMVLVMAIFPALFVGVFTILDPELMGSLFNTLPGQLVLATVGLLVYVSSRWAGRILARVE